MSGSEQGLDLIEAAKAGHLDIVKALLPAAERSINHTASLLLEAATHCDWKLVSVLLSAGIDVNKFSALAWAVSFLDVKFTEMLLERPDILVSKRDCLGKSALDYLACLPDSPDKTRCRTLIDNYRKMHRSLPVLRCLVELGKVNELKAQKLREEGVSASNL